MTTATRTVRYDDWDLRILREAKAYRDEIGEPMADQDAKLAEAERQFAERTLGTATPVADEEPYRGQGGSGHSNYSKPVDGPTPAQERFIRSLCAERGLDADEVLKGLTKSKASRKIDELKAMPRQAQAPAAPRPATERQSEFLQDLLASRENSYDPADPTLATFEGASAAITALLEAPRVRKVADHGIRHGRYAFQPSEGPAQFYRVAQNGRITVIAGPAEYPYNGQLNEALLAIKADTKAAAALYGQLIGSCGRCGLTLTDETSRSIGLGPICAGKSDW